MLFTPPCWLRTLFVLVVFGSTSAAADTHRIADAEALQALREGVGVAGDTLLLAPGTYPGLGFPPGTAPAEIRSEDPQNPAHLRGLAITGADGVLLADLVLDYRFSDGDDQRTRPFRIRNSRDITIRDTEIVGDVARGLGPAADGFGIAIGLTIRGSNDVMVDNVRISKFHRGMVVSQTQRFTLRNSSVTAIRSDGLNFAEVSEVLIEGNRVYNFDRSLSSTDHADLIQFWTNRTKNPTTDITIRGNLLLSGTTAWSHSIFMRNEAVDSGQAGAEMYYRNILIEENVIINAHLHGITLGEARGVMIRRNTLAQNPKSAGESPTRGLWNPMIRVSSRAENVRIFENVAFQVEGHQGQSSWSVRDNLLIQNKSLLEPNHYTKIFAGFPKGDPRDPRSYFYDPNGPLWDSRIGASMLRR